MPSVSVLPGADANCNVLQNCLRHQFDSGKDLGIVSVPGKIFRELGEGTLVLCEMDIRLEEVPYICRFLQTKVASDNITSLKLSRYVNSSNDKNSYTTKRIQNSKTLLPLSSKNSKLMKAVIEFIRLSKSLRQVIIHSVEVEHDLLESFATALSTTKSRIQWLQLTQMRLGDAGLRVLAPHITNMKSLQFLAIERCGLTDISAPLITSIVKAHEAELDMLFWNATLRVSPPSPTSTKPSGAEQKGASLDNSHIVDVRLSLVELAESMLRKVDMIGSPECEKRVGMWDDWIPDDDEGCRNAVHAVYTAGLVALSLNGNDFSDKSLELFCRNLAVNHWLIALNLANNRLTDQFASELLVPALQENNVMHVVVLGGNKEIGTEQSREILTLCSPPHIKSRYSLLTKPLQELIHRWKQLQVVESGYFKEGEQDFLVSPSGRKTNCRDYGYEPRPIWTFYHAHADCLEVEENLVKAENLSPKKKPEEARKSVDGVLRSSPMGAKGNSNRYNDVQSAQKHEDVFADQFGADGEDILSYGFPSAPSPGRVTQIDDRPPSRSSIRPTRGAAFLTARDVLPVLSDTEPRVARSVRKPSRDKRKPKRSLSADAAITRPKMPEAVVRSSTPSGSVRRSSAGDLRSSSAGKSKSQDLLNSLSKPKADTVVAFGRTESLSPLKARDASRHRKQLSDIQKLVNINNQVGEYLARTERGRQILQEIGPVYAGKSRSDTRMRVRNLKGGVQAHQPVKEKKTKAKRTVNEAKFVDVQIPRVTPVKQVHNTMFDTPKSTKRAGSPGTVELERQLSSATAMLSRHVESMTRKLSQATDLLTQTVEVNAALIKAASPPREEPKSSPSASSSTAHSQGSVVELTAEQDVYITSLIKESIRERILAVNV